MKKDYFVFAADNARREFQAEPKKLELVNDVFCPSCGDADAGPDAGERCPICGRLSPEEIAYAAYLKGEQPDPRD